MIQSVQRSVDVTLIQYIDTIVDVPVVKRRQEPTIQPEQKTLEVRENQGLDRVVDVPVLMEQQMVAEIPQDQRAAGVVRTVACSPVSPASRRCVHDCVWCIQVSSGFFVSREVADIVRVPVNMRTCARVCTCTQANVYGMTHATERGCPLPVF